MTTYTLFGQSGNGTDPSDSGSYTMGVQFKVTTTGCTLSGIWWYSGAWASTLPDTIGLCDVGSESVLYTETPSWSGAAGSGWVRTSFGTPQSLTSGADYIAAVDNSGGATGYSITSLYWDSGAGSGGITNGPLTAPNNAGAAHGQDVFHSGPGITYPSSAFNSSNYWVDPEITAPGGTNANAGLAAATGVPPSGTEDAVSLGMTIRGS